MPLNSIHIHIHSHLIISISVFVLILTVSSRPITTNTVTLTTSSGQKFEVRLHVALQSETIKQMIVDGDETILSFPNITGETMAKVLEYCNKHVYDHNAGSNITAVDEMSAFDAQFLDVHYETLFDLFRAANELNIKKLSDVVGRRIGYMMFGKSVEEIRIMFNINDSCVDHHPPQEELNPWAFH